MAIDSTQFRKTLSHFASGVTIVTTSSDGIDYGLTVSAFSSLSLEPPLVLICIEKSVKTHEAIHKAGKFAVNVLEESQVDLSNRFASRTEDKFFGLTLTRGSLDLPLLPNTIASIECRVTAELPGGDHTIFVGEIEASDTSEGAPLLYFRGSYRSLV